MNKGQLVLLGISMSGFALSLTYAVKASISRPTKEIEYPGFIYEVGMAPSSIPASIGFLLLSLKPIAVLPVFFKLVGLSAFLMAATYLAVVGSRVRYTPKETGMMIKEGGIAVATILAAIAVWNGMSLIMLYR